MGIWVEVHKYLRLCSSGIFGDQTGGSSPLHHQDLFSVHACTTCRFFTQRKTLRDNETLSHKETSCRLALFMQLLLLLFFFCTCMGPELSLFQLQFLSWLKAAAHDKRMCLFCAADVSLCGRGNEDDGGRRGNEDGGGGGTRGRLLHRLSDVLHVSQAMCQGQLWLCMWRLYVYVGGFFLPSRLDLFSAWLHFAPEFQFGMSMGRNTNYAQHNPVSAALLLLNKSQAITGYNPFQIL